MLAKFGPRGRRRNPYPSRLETCYPPPICGNNGGIVTRIGQSVATNRKWSVFLKRLARRVTDKHGSSINLKTFYQLRVQWQGETGTSLNKAAAPLLKVKY
jgi:hypothetical protein